MRIKTIKGKIFNLNLLTITITLLLVAIVFNLTISFYFQNRAISQLSAIASETKNTFIKQAANFTTIPKDKKSLADAFHKIQRSFDKALSIVNAEGFLIDKKTNIISLSEENAPGQDKLENAIMHQIVQSKKNNNEQKMFVDYYSIKYAAILISVPPNTIDINYIVLYASLDELNSLKKIINLILILILFLTALVSAIISSYISRQISKPLTSLSEHIRTLSERNFNTNIDIAVDNEIQELVDNVNKMSEKLEFYDQAQKIFLQNASHEFRTPLMIIQSYAEGLKHGVVEDKGAATEIIIDESKRLCSLVEDLLYLSRLDTDEEIYRFESIEFTDLIKGVTERMNVLAEKDNIEISLILPASEINLIGDEEKLSRAVTNLISNCIRYAKSKITIQVNNANQSPKSNLELTISDDGLGFEAEDLTNLFARFYKGKKGKSGLGLPIAKTIIDRHKGTIVAKNIPNGGAVFIVSLPIK